jgi:molecular chaperone GrpE
MDTERDKSSDINQESEDAAEETSQKSDAEELTLDSLKEALAKEKEQSGRYLSNWQRAQADLVNYKKRVGNEQAELAKYASVPLVAGLLSVLDDFERGLQSMPSKLMGLTWLEGVFLVHRKLQGILEAHGLSEIKALGEDFDPTLHEAVMYGEGDEGKVIEEMQKGFKLHDRVIRPAMVQVGQGASKEEGSEETPEPPTPEPETEEKSAAS